MSDLVTPDIATKEEIERRKRKISLEIFVVEDPDEPSKLVMAWNMETDAEHKKGQTMEEMALVVLGTELALQEIKGVALMSIQKAKYDSAHGVPQKPGGLYRPNER